MKLAIIGDPVAHSESPAIFAKFFESAGVAGSYEAIRVAAGDGARAIADLRSQGYRGLNVTTPLKEEAFELCCAQVPKQPLLFVDSIASATRSVNVLLLQPDGIYGFNTDAFGAWVAVGESLGTERLSGMRILVLGAGPTARAAIWQLQCVRGKVLVWSRTAARARATAEDYGAQVWDGEPVDVVFSTLPPEAEWDAAIDGILHSAPTVIDANYGPRAKLGTRLQRDVTDGMHMLRPSAAASFRLFSMSPTEKPDIQGDYGWSYSR